MVKDLNKVHKVKFILSRKNIQIIDTAGLTTHQLADAITYSEQNYLSSFIPGLHVPPAIINKYTAQH